jgi:plasmid stabilization system protein ParE
LKYRVIIEPPASAEMEKAFVWIAERAPESVAKWFDGLEAAIRTLDTFPERCPLAAAP